MPLRERYRTAVVTGAGSGLGAAFAEMLLAEGVGVWGTSRDPARLTARPGFAAMRLDLNDPASIDAAWTASEADSGGVELLLNNAGAGIFGPESALSTQVREEQRAVLFEGPSRLARLAAQSMGARGRGTIVNITSLAVELPIPFMGPYNAHKAQLAAFSAELESECAPRGVAVIDFRPGDFRTNFNRAMFARADLRGLPPAAARVRARLERIMAAAPPPEQAAYDLRLALTRGRRGVVRSGSFFQARVAPWGNRLLPAAMMRWLRSFYFGSSDS